jgi:hypothetical protein
MNIYEYETITNDAGDLANDLVLEEVAPVPILAFIDEKDWHLLENSESVDAIKPRGGAKYTIGDLKSKKVVFCRVGKPDTPILDMIAEDWENIIEGGVVRIKLTPALKYL